MKILKILSVILLALMLAFTMIACNDEEESSSQSESSQESSSSKVESESTESESTEIESTESESAESESTESESTESESTESESTESESEEPNPVEKWQSNASSEVQNAVEELLYSKHKLTYNEDGSFKVVIFADMHINIDGSAEQLQRAKDNVKNMVDKQKPDLVILTGDNIINSGSEAKARANIDVIVSYLEEKEIPWCHVFGNHDHENSISKTKQQAIYESYDYCISKEGPDLWGLGNYVHGIYNADGSLGAVIYCLDSGAYAADGSYDYIKNDQIAWYKETSELLQEYNNGELVYGMMAFHIPLIENREAEKNKNNTEIVYEYSGSAREGMCPSNTDTELLETIWERGDIKAIVTGHDHTNDYMYNYKGVKLTASPTISEMGYFYNVEYMGSRVFDLNASTIENIPTYVSYVVEKFNPDDFEDLNSDILMEDFEGDFADPVISGWASEGLDGTATIEKVEGKGVGGSSALSISRDSVKNFEFVIDFAEMGQRGSNKYLVLWCDFTNVNFRKACMGLASSNGNEKPYRTDDNDNTSPKYYYLADGATEWEELSHGGDGCFGQDDGGSVMGKKGYFAFAIDDLRQSSAKMDEDTLVTGFYMYASLYWGEAYLNKPFYIDNIILCEDYTTIELPTE